MALRGSPLRRRRRRRRSIGVMETFGPTPADVGRSTLYFLTYWWRLMY
jgi:hypothetical protein